MGVDNPERFDIDAQVIIIIIIRVLIITLTCNLLKWCDKIKVSNLLLPRKSGTLKSLQPLSTLGTLWDLGQLGSRSLGLPNVHTISMQCTHSMANWINLSLPPLFGILRLRTRPTVPHLKKGAPA